MTVPYSARQFTKGEDSEEGRLFNWSGVATGTFSELGVATAFPVGCLWVACPGTPGTGDIVPALFSSGAAGHCHRGPSSPWPEHPLYFSHSMALRKDIKDQRDVLFALFGV